MKAKNMFRTEKVEKLVKYALLTGFVSGDVPTSVMLISPPEHAKTSILRGISCKMTYETSDLSPKPIVDTLIPKVLNENLHHIVVPDLVKPLSHKSATVDSLIAFLNAVTEEGIQNQLFFGQILNLPKPVKFGIITSVTPEFFIKFFKRWNDIGFITRFLPISYMYSKTTITDIHELIKNNKLLDYDTSTEATNGISKKFIKNDSMKIKIIIPESEAAFLALQAQTISEKISAYKIPVYTQGGNIAHIRPNMLGFRLQRQLRMLVSAIALSDNKTEVNFTHVEELQKILEYIGYPDKPAII